jgi:hypothetical protein
MLYRDNWQGTPYKAQLVTQRKSTALLYKKYLDEFGMVSSEVLISGPDDREGNEEVAEENIPAVQQFWKKMMAKHGSEEQYNKNVISPHPSDDDLDRLIEFYLNEQSGTHLKTATPPQAFGPEISEDDLLASVAFLADSLHKVTDAGKKLRLATPSPNPAATLEEIAADFVTPGDLFRSKSLITIGELRP